MVIRPFRPEDAPAVSHVVRRNLLEVNIRDYSPAHMEEMAAGYDAAKVLSVAERGHMIVAWEGETILGVGAICHKEGLPQERELLTLFILPDRQGEGIGRALVEHLEQDELFRTAKRVTIPASLTAHRFYARLGYGYEGGEPRVFDNENYHMEKIPT